MNSISISISIIFTLFLIACRPEESKKQHPQTIDQNKLKEQFISANQQLIMKENDEMDYYAKTHQLTFTNTNSGIRFCVYKTSAKGDSISDGDIVTMNYKVMLLDGTECYSSKADGSPKTFKVGEFDIESGIHKGIRFIKQGDKAFFLIPSHLAHGLLGDYKKIPPQSPIVYDIEILSVKKEIKHAKEIE